MRILAEDALDVLLVRVQREPSNFTARNHYRERLEPTEVDGARSNLTRLPVHGPGFRGLLHKLLNFIGR
jgi:hypothetical protein